MGELYENKDGRYLLNSHPMSDAECTFPTGFWIYNGFLTQSMRCSDFEGSADGDSICGITAMKSGVLAGHSCQGGLFYHKDSNDGTTGEACNGGGGVWIPYTCSEAEQFLLFEESSGLPEEEKQYLKEFWWAGKC